MQTDLGPEFRATVERASADLARAVIALLHARLGELITGTKPASLPARPARPKKQTAGEGPSKRGGPRFFPGPAAAREALVAIVAAGDGMTIGEIVAKSGQTRRATGYGLRMLRKQKRVFMAGDRRLARWAASPEVAQKAAAAARARGSARDRSGA